MTSTTKKAISERETKRRDKQRHQKQPAYTTLAEPPLLPVEQLEASTSAGVLNTQLYARPPPWPGPDQRAVFTIVEFCDAHDISTVEIYERNRNRP